MTHTCQSSPQFTAIVLAADRSSEDPVALDAGVSCKAIAPIAGKPMVLRVLDALENSAMIHSIVLCGPSQASLADCPQLLEKIKQTNISWIPSLDSPSRSVESALEKINDNEYVLLTTADHVLLDAGIVNYFVDQSLQNKVDACVGLVEYRTISESYPGVKRTVIELSDGGFCSCNLFAFMNVKGRKLVPFWRKLEQNRKKPARLVAGLLGMWGMLLYVTGKLSLDSALARFSARVQIKIKLVLLPFPRAGVDVDTVKDRQFAETILQEPEK